VNYNQARAKISQAPGSTGIALALATTGLEALQPLALVLAYQLGSTRLVNGHNPIDFMQWPTVRQRFQLGSAIAGKALPEAAKQTTQREEYCVELDTGSQIPAPNWV